MVIMPRRENNLAPTMQAEDVGTGVTRVRTERGARILRSRRCIAVC